MKIELSTPFCLFNGSAILDCDDSSVTFGLTDIDNEELKERLSRMARNRFGSSDFSLRFEKISEAELKRIVSISYGQKSGEKRWKASALKNEEKEREAVMLLDSLLTDAAKMGATDIHIEESSVLFRVCGRLQKVCGLGGEGQKAGELLRRVKALSKMDLVESRRPQDGSFVFERETSPLFVRSSVIPVLTEKNPENLSESAVLRLLDPLRRPLKIEKLGFARSDCEKLVNFTRMKEGLFLICGSTGSGKSTTACSMLQKILDESKERLKIISVEDPPEYLLPGIVQIKADSSSKTDFSDILPFIFRHDPDVIFIGEIRDGQSAATAVRAALSGHLVISTIHAGGFDECLLRLEDLGVSREKISASLKGLAWQKLFWKEEKPCLEGKVVLFEENQAGLLQDGSFKSQNFDFDREKLSLRLRQKRVGKKGLALEEA